MTETHRLRRPSLDRARRRAIRDHAARAGVPYSVAARQIDNAGTSAAQGRTIYPAGTDVQREQLIKLRGRRALAERVQDTRRAADIPIGRAAHVADRFPPTRGEPGTGVGPMYHGESRQDLLAFLYSVIALKSAEMVPSVGDLAWAAELGEETTVDTECAHLDRAARLLLDLDPVSWALRIESALATVRSCGDARVRGESVRLVHAGRADMTLEGWDYQRLLGPLRGGTPACEGVRHILDAVLVVADDGHAPGTRVRMLGLPYAGPTGTITGAVWGPAGPPLRYQVLPDAADRAVIADPHDLLVLSNCLTSDNCQYQTAT